MGTTAKIIAATLLAAAGVTACDDDDDINEQIEDEVVEPGDTVEDGVPFDPDVPPGVDTDTGETENQGFDPVDPETGNNSDISDDDGLGGDG